MGTPCSVVTAKKFFFQEGVEGQEEVAEEVQKMLTRYVHFSLYNVAWTLVLMFLQNQLIFREEERVVREEEERRSSVEEQRQRLKRLEKEYCQHMER